MPSAPPPPDHLADMPMYCLYQAWSQASPVFVRLCEGRFGITRREWRLLAAIVEYGPLTSAELAATARLDLVRTSRALGSLSEKGWVARVRDARDRRVANVMATAAGQALYRAMLPEITRLNELLMADLSADEARQLLRLLQIVAERGARMATENVVADKASRRQGGTRRAAARRAGPAED
ncbi:MULTISPECIES: MarR family winged helix-turn-helix transcriptional regulator [Bordetella]|uniref:DNA-binding protein n=2 Tax=Bordetella TaxID=517 RepID=A0A261VSG8_9BORD|nr:MULTISPECIES: MarR family winged helix-turn-helix transcriptional regulator [Bordetella]MDM9560724.1 MarR family winged helix-turn-helix transcriptional regulator [Bordetella petrii]OZI76550.1 DNA-binding protein [Bordetella genomosp. 2]